MAIHITGDPAADQVLTEHPFALLMGMMLDQQFPMERAFAGPAKVLDRFGIARPGGDRGRRPRGVRRAVRRAAGRAPVPRLDGRPASRRWPRIVVDEYDGHAERLWTEAALGRELLRRLQALPGFGKQKAQIFIALLGKQLDVRPDGLGGGRRRLRRAGVAPVGGRRRRPGVAGARCATFKKEKKKAAAG